MMPIMRDEGEVMGGERRRELPAPPRERHLGLMTALMLVVASMIGTGAFTTTGFLLSELPSLSTVLAAWALGGGIALCGALAYAELVSALPENGGEYHLLSRIYHPALGFVSGWTSLVVGFSAPIAAAALAFGAYFKQLYPWASVSGTACVLIALLSLLHAWRGSVGGGLQNWVTAIKLVLIVMFITLGLLHLQGKTSHDEWAGFDLHTLASPSFGVALIYVSFAYSGWNAAVYVAGELKQPEKILPWALIGGTVLVVLLYCGLNLVFLRAATPAELAGVLEVGHLTAYKLFGEAGSRIVSLLVLLALFTSVGALIMTGPRVYEAVGQDYGMLRFLVRRGQEEHEPVKAIVLQALLSIAMTFGATFEQLLNYIGFTLALFAMLTVAGVFVLRWREPALPRPYRAWGYPWTTLAAVLLMAWMLVHELMKSVWVSLAGALTLALGALLYAFARKTASRSA